MGILETLRRRIIVRRFRSVESAGELAVVLRRKAKDARRAERDLKAYVQDTTDAVKQLLGEHDPKKQQTLAVAIRNNAKNAFDSYKREMADGVSIFNASETILDDIYKDYVALYNRMVEDYKQGINAQKAQQTIATIQQHAQELKRDLEAYRKGTKRETRGRKARGMIFERAITGISTAERDIIVHAKKLQTTFDDIGSKLKKLEWYEKEGKEEMTLQLFTEILNQLLEARQHVEDVINDYFIVIDRVRDEAKSFLHVIEVVRFKLPHGVFEELEQRKQAVEQEALKEARYYGRVEARAA